VREIELPVLGDPVLGVVSAVAIMICVWWCRGKQGSSTGGGGGGGGGGGSGGGDDEKRRKKTQRVLVTGEGTDNAITETTSKS
jgi:hypothetical protein